MFASGLKNSTHVVEVGSSDGREALISKSVKNITKHIIVEANPQTYSRLLTLLNDSKYLLINKLVASHNDYATQSLHLTESSNLAVPVSFISTKKYDGSLISSSPTSLDNDRVHNIQTTTLSDVISSHIPQSSKLLIKMDLEGQEFPILDSCLDILSDTMTQVTVLMEVHPFSYDKCKSIELFNRLWDRGFYPVYIESAGQARPKSFKNQFLSKITSCNNRSVYSNASKVFVQRMCTEPYCELILHKRSYTSKTVRSILLTNAKNYLN